MAAPSCRFLDAARAARFEESVKSLDDDGISGRRSRVPGGDQCQSAEFSSSSVNFNVLMFHVCTHELIIEDSKMRSDCTENPCCLDSYESTARSNHDFFSRRVSVQHSIHFISP